MVVEIRMNRFSRSYVSQYSPQSITLLAHSCVYVYDGARFGVQLSLVEHCLREAVLFHLASTARLLLIHTLVGPEQIRTSIKTAWLLTKSSIEVPQ